MRRLLEEQVLTLTYVWLFSNPGADLLKVIFFARSEFTFDKFAQNYGLILLKKTIGFEKNFVKLCQKYEKVPVLQALRLKVKFLHRF